MAVTVNFFPLAQAINIPKNSTKQENTFEYAKKQTGDFKKELAHAAAPNKTSANSQFKVKRDEQPKKVHNVDNKEQKTEAKSNELKDVKQSTVNDDINADSRNDVKLREEVKQVSGEEFEVLKELLAMLQINNTPILMTENNQDLEELTINNELLNFLAQAEGKINEMLLGANESNKAEVDSLKQLLASLKEAAVLNEKGDSLQPINNLEQVKTELIQKLDAFIKTAQNNNESTISKGEVQEALNISEISVQKTFKPLFQDQSYKVKPDVSVEKQNINAEINLADNKDTKSDTDSKKQDESFTASKSVAEFKTETIQSSSPDENFITKLGSIQSDVVIKNNGEIIKVEKAVEIPKAEVMKQIVQKAEIVLKDGKSEMNINLEPEHLGKLSLKIAVEKGIITAKFVAENQAVKETIESNFNQLKDMLHEKGISVQGFSVSVGHENREFNSKNNLNVWKETIKDSKKQILTEGYVEIDNYEGISKINPYNYHEGKVDFKA